MEGFLILKIIVWLRGGAYMKQYDLKKCSIFYVMLDVITILFSYALAWYVRVGNPWYGVTEHNKRIMGSTYVAAILLIVPIYLILYTFFNLYSSRTLSRKWLELVNVFKDVFGGAQARTSFFCREI